MVYILAIVSQALILFPAFVGLIRFKKIDPVYYPFLALLWIGTVNEMVCFTENHILDLSSYINNNLYSFFEGMLIVWFFHTTAYINKKIFYALESLFVIAFFYEKLTVHLPYNYGFYYSLIDASAIVFLSIIAFNKIIVTERGFPLKNGMFLICMSFIIYFTFNVIWLSFWYYGITSNIPFIKAVQIVMMYVNVITNITLGIATLWLPIRRPSLLDC